MRFQVLLTSALVLGFAGGGSAHAQDRSQMDERAARHFHSGESYFAAEDFERALSEFEVAYRLSERPELLYNIGLTFERLGRWSEAVDAHERFIAADPDHPSAASARERSDRARARAEESGGEGSGDVPVTETPRDEDGGGVNLAPWLVLGASGAVGVAALVTGLIAHGISQDLASTCVGGVCPEDKQDDASRGEALAVTSTVLTFVALAGAATSVVLFVLSGGEREEPTGDATLGLVPLPGGGVVTGHVAF